MSEETPSQTLVIDDARYTTQLTKKFLHRKKYAAPDPSVFRAVIPGIIRKIYVRDGQKVKRGDDLFILEAMKMKNLIASPRDGRIKTIHVVVGKMVTKDAVLLEFDD
jgi:biotin carboxyl carrier protein